jgi:hypothetical protein
LRLGSDAEVVAYGRALSDEELLGIRNFGTHSLAWLRAQLAPGGAGAPQLPKRRSEDRILPGTEGDPSVDRRDEDLDCERACGAADPDRSDIALADVPIVEDGYIPPVT